MPNPVSTKFKPGDECYFLQNGRKIDIIICAPYRAVYLDDTTVPIVWYTTDKGIPAFRCEPYVHAYFDRHREKDLSGEFKIIRNSEGKPEIASSEDAFPNGGDYTTIEWREGDGF